MALCSRDTIPSCVICGDLTMEPGVDDRPAGRSYDEQGYVCSDRCEAIDILRNAPDTDPGPILLAAYETADTTVRVHRAACEPFEGSVIGWYPRLNAFTFETDGGERDALLSMIERVEVVE
jgi:hypothetical protein